MGPHMHIYIPDFAALPIMISIPELIHESLMEFRDLSNPLSARSQERGPEMQSPFFLTESTARHHADPRCVEEAKAVELVGCAAFFLCLFDGFWRYVDGGEEVHGALRVQEQVSIS